MLVWIVVAIFGVPIIVWKLLQRFKNGGFAATLVRFLGLALIEAYAFHVFAFYFLDMYNDLVALHPLLSEQLVPGSVINPLLVSLTRPLFFIAFALSFAIRTIRHPNTK